MQGTIAALAMMATVAAGNTFQPRHWHMRRDNTTVPGDTLTTLTVISTEVATITSCAPTVTDCPADETDIATLPESDKTVVVVTNTVALTTTVCPVSEAPEISASVITNTNIVGTTLTEAPEVPTDAVPTGIDASPSVTASSTALPEAPEQPGSPDKPADEPTTTVTATSTDTTTVTVPAASETPGGDEVGSPGDDGGDGCVCPSAVTVTAPASTVYVTIGGDGASPTAGDGDDIAPETTSGSDDSAEDDVDDEEEDDDDDYDECEPDEVVTRTSTINAPYPTGNGTVPTGFARLRR